MIPKKDLDSADLLRSPFCAFTAKPGVRQGAARQNPQPSGLGLFSFAYLHDFKEEEVKSFTFTFNR